MTQLPQDPEGCARWLRERARGLNAEAGAARYTVSEGSLRIQAIALEQAADDLWPVEKVKP